MIQMHYIYDVTADLSGGRAQTVMGVVCSGSNTGHAWLALLLLTSCCAAWFLRGANRYWSMAWGLGALC